MSEENKLKLLPTDKEVRDARDNLYRLLDIRVKDSISMYEHHLISTREFIDKIATLYNLS